MIANRIGRLEFLFWWVASIVCAGILAAIAAVLTNTTIGYYPHPLAEALILIAASILMLTAVLSRFHDIGWPGLALILMFLPLVNVLALLFLLIVPGHKSRNLYGEPTPFLKPFRKTGSDKAPD